jgi:hypothetical protein
MRYLTYLAKPQKIEEVIQKKEGTKDIKKETKKTASIISKPVVMI